MEDPGSISLLYEPPPPELQSLVSIYYQFDCTFPQFEDIERADLAQLRFFLSGQASNRFADGRTFDNDRVTIVGPTSAPVVSSTNKGVSLFGMGLLPAGWAIVMGDHADRYGDRAVDAVELLGAHMSALHAELVAAPGIAERSAIVSDWLRRIAVASPAPPVEFIGQVDRWLEASVDPAIDDLAAATGLSVRQLERMTKRVYGLPPKQLARKYRALRAASLLALGKDLSSEEMDGAFYDQSHLIREIKHFTGMTPGQIKARTQERLMGVTARGRNAIAGQVGPLISNT